MKPDVAKFKSDPQNRFQAIIDRLLLTHYAVIETDASPNTVLKSLSHIQAPKAHILEVLDAFFFGMSQFESTVDFSENRFKIGVVRSENSNYVVATVYGQIVYSDGYEETLVYLKASNSWITSMSILATAVFLLGFFGQLTAVVLGTPQNHLGDIAFFGLFSLLYGLFSYINSVDRNWLVDAIYDVIDAIPEAVTNSEQGSQFYAQQEAYEDLPSRSISSDNA